MWRPTIGALVGMVLLSGCGAQKVVPEDGANTAAVSICDGSGGVRLAVVIGGGGPAMPGTAMLSENGWRFLLVDGSCVAWILTSDNEPLRTLTVSGVEEQRLASALRLSNWTPFAGRHGGGCADAPGITYRFDRQRIDGAVCGLADDDPIQQLNAAFDTQVEELAATATAVSGDMRYLVLPDPGIGVGGNRATVPWPLDVPIESVALTEQQAFQYMRGGSRRATGVDASRLRAIRTTALNAAATDGIVYDFTPVAAPNGVLYQLFARDSVPLENDNGLLPPDIL
jgi:hypothetical protein